MRAARLEADYAALVRRHGEEQLTLIEREAYRQARADLAAGRRAEAQRSLEQAEAALRSARERLDQ